ncbi:hypothetical protein DPMN_140553 [Dreissena polymorpha]|uniref:Uncharacterized protein n=1 Tax=Dreissena polymorpha TaxID=45954 RepID=A0A9D4GBR4_DREPO|nr:hypothetical protein DPMN_140553 [Dreissena polymorpha]
MYVVRKLMSAANYVDVGCDDDEVIGRGETDIGFADSDCSHGDFLSMVVSLMMKILLFAVILMGKSFAVMPMLVVSLMYMVVMLISVMVMIMPHLLLRMQLTLLVLMMISV